MKSGEPIHRLDRAAAVPKPHVDLSAPAVWARLEEAVKVDGVDLRDLAELAGMNDEVRTAILNAANRGEQRPVRPFDDLTRAMVYIGLRRVRHVILENAFVPEARPSVPVRRTSP
jgi:hypothetical protein